MMIKQEVYLHSPTSSRRLPHVSARDRTRLPVSEGRRLREAIPVASIGHPWSCSSPPNRAAPRTSPPVRDRLRKERARPAGRHKDFALAVKEQRLQCSRIGSYFCILSLIPYYQVLRKPKESMLPRALTGAGFVKTTVPATK